jgi:tetratricopeptide (TPR) repeat protein
LPANIHGGGGAAQPFPAARFSLHQVQFLFDGLRVDLIKASRLFMVMAFKNQLIRVVGGALAVSAMASLAMAQTAGDYFILKTGQRRDVVITRADSKNLYYQTPSGDAPMPWSSINNWNLAERKGVKEALAAVDAGKYAESLPVLKPLASNYMVLPSPWVQDVVVAMVRCHAELKQFTEANAIAKQFGELQPTQLNRVKPFLAVALAGEKKFDEAIAALTEVVKAAAGKLVLTPAEARMFGQAYLTLGDCFAGKGDEPKALECYLTTTVLYYQDEQNARVAQAKAEELKKKLQPKTAKASDQ